MVTVITIDNMEPIKDHPRYRQRIGLIVTVAIAFIFCILSILTAYWNQAPWVAELVVVSPLSPPSYPSNSNTC
jgi:hypothetical protein